MGWLCGLDVDLDWHAAERSLQSTNPEASAVEVVCEGADHGPYYQYDDIQFIRSLPFDLSMDPSADILVAYEMNGNRSTPIMGRLPVDRAELVWRRVGQVAHPDRRGDEAVSG